MYKHIFQFEKKLAKFTGAPYVVVTDCCTHAIEMCMRYDEVKEVKSLPCYTYLSVPMTLVKLGIKFKYKDTHWLGEYNFEGTRIWDSARLLHPKMFKFWQRQTTGQQEGWSNIVRNQNGIRNFEKNKL